MKKLTIIASLMALSATTFAQTWSVDKAHSKIGYSVVHMGLSDSEGNFKAFEGKITASKADFSDAVFEISADVNSLNTENEMRDKHLKSPDFFNAEKFPSITFKSSSFKKVSGKNYKVSGDLTLHGVTKPVTFNVVFNGTATNPMSKKETAGFSFSGTIKRKDFGIGAEMPATMLGEDVTLRASGEFTKD
ncbi:YceI family protein [Chitinophaga tropicalis]|uniref:Polyisoprenoid-binding protein n=1 Tax=Chitinophaga tropicalis TaxID=2683588 RepID=A0A7K1UCY5_9BACT|nr:YceI family protein [Chitinophaga tropicalis]MVT12203.1 polyisoprenoid-binding protein [Chitinophaga tropicalis]